MSRERSESGRFVETVTHERVLSTFSAVEGPVVTSSDVAERLDCTPDAARGKLEELYREGRLGRRETAGRVVYWLLDETEHDDADAPIFDRSTFASGHTDTSERVDEILYGGAPDQ